MFELRAETAKILDLADTGSSSATDARIKDDTLGFEVNGLHYHDEGCPVYQGQRKGTTDKKTMCQICKKDEVILDWARASYSTPRGKDK